MTKKVLILHYEFYKSYLNKNIGYFIDSAIAKGYKVDFLSSGNAIENIEKKNNFRLIGLEGFKFEGICLYAFLMKNLKRYEYVWIYPNYRYLISLLFLFKLYGVKVIIKTDSMRVPQFGVFSPRRVIATIKRKLIQKMSAKIIVENDELLAYFGKGEKVVKSPIGLSLKNINLINSLQNSVEREKVILYVGRITYAKGLDRLINAFEELIDQKIITDDWNLKVVGKVIEEDYHKDILTHINESLSLKKRVIIEEEKSDEMYYSELLKASLIVLPTRSEGLPNILADAYFSNRLFLATSGAKMQGIINDHSLYCENVDDILRASIANVLNNLDNYYDKYERIYNKDNFVIIDGFFDRILDYKI